MIRSSSPRSRLLRAAPLLGLLAAVAAGSMLIPSDRAATAQPAGPLPVELQCVPADAAVFVHADAAALWGGEFGKAVRAADPKDFGELQKQSKELFGLTPDALKSVTLFLPKIKDGPDTQAFGAVFTFSEGYDFAKLKAGLTKLSGLPKLEMHRLSDRSAMMLVGLDASFAKPRPAGEKGPLSAIIREAATGKHTLVVASTPANLPDEIRGDNLPGQLRVFQPIFKAESVAVVFDLNKDFAAEVRVKSANAAQAADAEKALGAFVGLLQEGLLSSIKETEKDLPTEPDLKDVVAMMKAAQAGLKDAKLTTTGTEARAVVKIAGELPIGTAVVGAIRKVRLAAAASQSANNLKQIAIAMHNYLDANNAFPPAAVCDKKGKPMLSWRVLILPYIEQDALYKEFKLDEPWDSDTNKKLLSKMPKVYVVPTQSEKDTAEFKTHYRVFVGNGALFDYLKGPRIQDIADGTSNTVLVATAAEAVPWTKPEELAFDPEKDMGKLLGDAGLDRLQLALADGSVRAIPRGVPAKKLNAWITRAGGEVIDDRP